MLQVQYQSQERAALAEITRFIAINYNLRSTLSADFQLRALLLSKHCHGLNWNHKLWLYFTEKAEPYPGIIFEGAHFFPVDLPLVPGYVSKTFCVTKKQELRTSGISSKAINKTIVVVANFFTLNAHAQTGKRAK